MGEQDLSLARKSAWTLGAAWAFSAGLFTFPVNLQATVVYGFALFLFWHRVRAQPNVGFSDSPTLTLLLGLAVAGLLAFTTNDWLVLALHLCALYLIVDLLLRGFSDRRPEGVIDLVRQTAHLLWETLRGLFSRVSLREFLASQPDQPTATTGHPVATKSSQRWTLTFVSVIGSFVLFYLFHLLFREVNDAYGAFMDPVIDWIWLVFFRGLLFTVIHAYLLFVLLNARSRATQSFAMPSLRPLPTSTALLGVILVTGVFCVFQLKYVFVNAPHLKFSDLSQYTQKGFLQLLVAIVLGYAISLLAIGSREKWNVGSKSLALPIAVFLLELVLTTGFSAHKIFVLQYVFGLKDERILASVGILFICFSICLLQWRVLRYPKAIVLFRYQWQFLIGATLLFSLVNVDVVSTTLSPIRYYKDGKAFPDYSYLLGNSYDNVGYWPALMRDMREQNPPHPGRGYFWGFESPRGRDLFLGRYSPLCVRRPAQTKLTAGDHTYHVPTGLLASAYQKYAPNEGGNQTKEPFTLSRALDFNIHEYRAYALVRSSNAELRKFDEFLEQHCRTFSRGPGGRRQR